MFEIVNEVIASEALENGTAQLHQEVWSQHAISSNLGQVPHSQYKGDEELPVK